MTVPFCDSHCIELNVSKVVKLVIRIPHKVM